MQLRFEWDPVKAASNQRKHGVSFELAARVFADPEALIEVDRIENGEERWLAIGLVDGSLMLTVVHGVREYENSETIRIISARRADRKERARYEAANL